MLKNILQLLETNTNPVTDTALPVINVWRVGTHYLMFFTLHHEVFSSHYDPETKTSYLCSGDKCPACEAGVKVTEHVYLPGWDAQNRRIVILKFHNGHGGPATQIVPFLNAYRGQLATIVAVLKCVGHGKFTITAHNLNPEAERGALQCQEFCRALEAGEVNLKACVKSLSGKEIQALESVQGMAVNIVGAEVVPTGVAVDQTLIGDSVAPSDQAKGA